jgi:tRNA-splicing ligase RtcB (3'-phosphate/5'-hydroxy nucleic acid ligase)
MGVPTMIGIAAPAMAESAGVRLAQHVLYLALVEYEDVPAAFDSGPERGAAAKVPAGEASMERSDLHARLERVDEVRWRIPRDARADMRVDGIVFADAALMDALGADPALDQVANVATLPGIQTASLAMPDIHWGYGFPIGGVAATDPAEGGVVSPGGVGYDINCGVRLLRSELLATDLEGRLEGLIDALAAYVPAGVGRAGPHHFDRGELETLMREGVPFLRRRGLADDDDVAHCEAEGRIDDARPELVSDVAYQRGADQCGTVGSGNHFVEVLAVDRIADAAAAAAFGLEQDQVCVLVHSGSRGLGYQVCDDALRSLRGVPARYGIELPDRQLACAPLGSPEGEAYLGAMRAAANYAFCNRQLLAQQVREVFERFFGRPWQRLGLTLVYDVAHNLAKLERHVVDGAPRTLCVHRKGATRAFPAGHAEVPAAYRDVGQPVIVPGDMGRASWVLAGGPQALASSFGSTCHGAGRALSRKAALRAAKGRDVRAELAARGVVARASSRRGLD